MATNFVADFFTIKNGIKSRTRIQGSSQVNLNGMQSDFAVQSYLQQKYQADIIINKIEWK
jgi:hypothetical protein